MLHDFGIGFSNRNPIQELLTFADAAEQEGLSFWLNEGYHNRSSVVVMSAIASRTKRASLGLGILSPLMRHPYLIAMEAGALDELSGGRLVLGLGLGVSGARRQNIDVLKSKPIEIMRESLHILRVLLAGDVVSSTPLFDASKEGVKLGFKPIRKDIPIILGAMHSKMLELGGEIFDGVLLNYACPISYAKFAVECIERGLRKRTKNQSKRPPARIGALVLLSVDSNHDAAVEASRRYLPHYLARAYPITLKYAGITVDDIAPVIEAVRKSEQEKAISLVTDEMIAKLTISGNPEECVQEIRKFSDAGVNQIIAEEIMGPEPLNSIKMIGREIAPMVVGRKKSSSIPKSSSSLSQAKKTRNNK